MVVMVLKRKRKRLVLHPIQQKKNWYYIQSHRQRLVLKYNLIQLTLRDGGRVGLHRVGQLRAPHRGVRAISLEQLPVLQEDEERNRRQGAAPRGGGRGNLRVCE